MTAPGHTATNGTAPIDKRSIRWVRAAPLWTTYYVAAPGRSESASQPRGVRHVGSTSPAVQQAVYRVRARRPLIGRTAVTCMSWLPLALALGPCAWPFASSPSSGIETKGRPAVRGRAEFGYHMRPEPCEAPWPRRIARARRLTPQTGKGVRTATGTRKANSDARKEYDCDNESSARACRCHGVPHRPSHHHNPSLTVAEVKERR